MLEVMEEKAMIQFLEKFTDYPFLVRFQGPVSYTHLTLPTTERV